MRKIKYWVLVSVFLLLQLADGLLTYINTPDLSMEGNPLVARLGLGWGALLIANIMGFILMFITSYYSYFKYETKYTSETKFTSYCSQISFDRPDMFWKGIIPKHITPIIAAVGYSFLYAMIFSRTVVVLEWLYITFNENWMLNNYFSFTGKYFFGRFDVFVGGTVTLICMLYWFYKEFKKQLNVKDAEE